MGRSHDLMGFANRYLLCHAACRLAGHRETVQDGLWWSRIGYCDWFSVRSVLCPDNVDRGPQYCRSYKAPFGAGPGAVFPCALFYGDAVDSVFVVSRRVGFVAGTAARLLKRGHSAVTYNLTPYSNPFIICAILLSRSFTFANTVPL